MNVRCERCKAQYVFDDERVTVTGLTVQCTSCGHVFRVRKKEIVVTVPVRPGEYEGVPLPATAAAPRPRASRPPAAAGAAAGEAGQVAVAGAVPPPPASTLPIHDIEPGLEVDARARSRRRRTPAWASAALLVLALVASGYVLAPALLSPAPAPREAALPIALPVTIEVKADQPPPPALPAPAPAVERPPAPEPARARPAPRGPKALLAEARRLLERGDSEGALELYGRVADEDPANAEALTGRGLCYLDLESYAPAEASFSAALKIDPGEADALLGLAETYRFQGKKAEAVSHYEKYLVQHPDGEDAEVARNALAELR